MIVRCKMCGGDLEVSEGASTCSCEFCGTKQTVPTVTDEGLHTLFNRANVLRMKGEFDKAADVYEKILQHSEKEAEAYWGLILCKYGIEYVEDPKTFRRVPTCHRASFDAVTADEDYQSAIKYADSVQRGIYEQQAAEIDTIQKGILALAQKEDPYDVFICYKETDDAGKRTPDSVLGNDIYYQLTREGFKVFYAAITLEDKLGSEYEPYIFSALHTSKVMLALGTKPEYFNSVWVKNEWSRFLKLMKKDRSKLLIPCFRDMDPYELPEEFAHLQAQDMSKIGFISDLVRGIKKVIAKESRQPQPKAEKIVAPQTVSVSGTTANAQVKRGYMALEDHEWEKADSFFEEALNLDPECAEAYLGKMLARDRKPGFESWVAVQKEKYSDATTERLEACPEDTEHIRKTVSDCAIAGYLDEETIKKEYKFDRGYDSAVSCRKSQKAKQSSELASERLLARAKQYAKGTTQKQIEDGLAEITAVLDQRIAQAQEQDQRSIARLKAAYEAHLAQADQKTKELNEDAQNRREQRYQSAVNLMKSASHVPSFEKAREALKAMNGYKDSDALAAQCQKEIDRLNKEKWQEAEQAAKKKKTITAIIAAVAVVCIAAAIVVTKVIVPNNSYNAALALMESGDYEAAISAFEAMNGYKDSAEQIEQCSAIITSDKIAGFANASVGDTIVYGSYEQDNDTSNGQEDIEWIVLAKEENQILVISKYALDCQEYNTSYTDVTWETCTLRTWMNSIFLNEAFTNEEQAYIPTATVIADQNPDYNTDAGNDTQDQIFLLSITDAEKYFSSDNDRMCALTAYAISQGAYTRSGYSVGGAATCWWWLRSPGYRSYEAVHVYNDGSVDCIGNFVDKDNGCVRPAMWINLESSSSESIIETPKPASAEEITVVKTITLDANLNVGDIVTFGSYEQDNNTSNGKEDIEWIVLDKDQTKLLLISKYALDCQQYNTTDSADSAVTWASCSLRIWLNGTFLDTAFSSQEAAQIATTTVTADENPNYSTPGGNDTQDQVFLLSITEARKYFSSDNDRMCVPTAYAIAQGAWTSSSYSVGGSCTCVWWLRSPGCDFGHAANVYHGGSVRCDGGYVSTDNDCVRPALWINLGS